MFYVGIEKTFILYSVHTSIVFQKNVLKPMNF